MSNNNIQLTDCPRDAIQGIGHMIPTEKKVAYINQLIKSRLFDCIDFGSFVSPKAVPQMSDTAKVLEGIQKSLKTKLLAIIANEKGAEIGTSFEKIDFLGYPFSISETFQQRNTKSSMAESLERVKRMQELISKTNQQLVIYISMAFGNPYGDPWHKDMVSYWMEQLHGLGITYFSLADTTSEATPELVGEVFKDVAVHFPALNVSAHLHSRIENALAKVNAAYTSGCRKFEGAVLGYGGCPFANDVMAGNIPSELLVCRFKKKEYERVEPLLQHFRDLIAE